MTATGWPWFLAWALAGALCALALVSILSIGIFIAPLAVAAIVLVARMSSGGPELLGLVTGAGFLGIVVWVLSRGEWDATRWLVGGLALCAAGVVAYGVARARPA